MNTVLDRLTLIVGACLLVTQPGISAQIVPGTSSHKSSVRHPFEARSGRHFARVRREEQSEFYSSESERMEAEPLAAFPSRMVPTRSSFLATWPAIGGATGYRLDVSTSPAFDSFVGQYHNLDVGLVTNRIVTHLNPATTYHYRVRPYTRAGSGADSVTMSSTTAAESGLVINPTFDSSITNHPNSAAIESMINRSIAIYQSIFSDPITIEIYFRYTNTLSNGTPLPNGAAAISEYVVYFVPWSICIESLKADSKTTNDASAYKNFPSLFFTNYLVPASAGGRAVGLDTPPAMFANGTVGDAGPYDGIVTLNSDVPYKFVRPAAAGFYDAQTAAQHEIDEVIGLGSYLGGGPEATDFRPEDLFAWSAPGSRSHSALGERYFSIDDGVTNIVNFSQVPMADFGDWDSESCPQQHFRVQNAFGCKGQSADISSASPEGVALDVVGYDLTADLIPPSLLGNISTRGLVKSGDQVLIGGFIITGTEPKPVIVRAIGPSLPVDGALSDPTLELHDDTSAIVASNDNWRGDQAAEIIASGVAPTNEKEAALIATLDPGSYTTVVSGVNGGTGVGLVEVYDLDQTVGSKLANISTRGFVGTDDNVLIGGFIVLGDSSSSTLIRAIGPSLTALGISNALQDPELELHDRQGTLIFSNDDWKDSQVSEIAATGIPPSNDAESAIVMTLAPDNYTAIVSGKANTTGVALVEIYQLQ